jgi:phosphatidylserine/phosphatidylglycerophosphate/cardiolipin synthase-like enzyme
MIIDDRLLRIGSANLNNRSMGLDTECDVVIEGEDEATRAAICNVREELMAEHLGTTDAKVRQVAQAAHSLLAGIDRLNSPARQLKPITVRRLGPTRPVWGTFLLDPRRPIEPLALLQRAVRHAARWPILPRLQQYFRHAEKG